MATLSSDSLAFEINYMDDFAGWIGYRFAFRWQGKSMVNDSILKRSTDYWEDRRDSMFLANEDEEDGLIPLIKKVLETDQAEYWEPLEPDIIITVYPEQYFPFLPSHDILLREGEGQKEKRLERQRLKREKGQLPDDGFTFIAQVDAYNLRDADCYYGQGLSLQLIVLRHELKTFLIDLEREYQDFLNNR